MGPIKIKNYEREHGPGTFPGCRPLDSRSLEEVRRQLTGALGIEATSSGREMLQVIQDRSELVEGADAENEDFDLGAVLKRLGLVYGDKLYLNWYRFDDVDEMCAADVIAHFSDIWYPASDDLEVFDRSMSWIVSITHFGAVMVIRMESG